MPPTIPAVTTQPCTSLALTAQRAAVWVPERGSRTPLEGAVFAPSGAPGALPIVSMLPGGGAQISSVEWAARALAAQGYVVVVTKPSSGARIDSYHLAAVTGIDQTCELAEGSPTPSPFPRKRERGAFSEHTDIYARPSPGWLLGEGQRV